MPERGLDGDENNILANANVMEDKNDGDDSTSELDS